MDSVFHGARVLLLLYAAVMAKALAINVSGVVLASHNLASAAATNVNLKAVYETAV